MNTKIKKFVEEHEEEIKIAVVIGAEVIGLCVLCAIVAKAAQAETLNSLHIRDVFSADGQQIGLNVNGIFYGKKK